MSVVSVEPTSSSPSNRAFIRCPVTIGRFEFVVLATLRATQLMRGCLPRIGGVHKATVIAQAEVAAGKILSASDEPTAAAQ